MDCSDSEAMLLDTVSTTEFSESFSAQFRMRVPDVAGFGDWLLVLKGLH
jgi:hypothetical protein